MMNLFESNSESELKMSGYLPPYPEFVVGNILYTTDSYDKVLSAVNSAIEENSEKISSRGMNCNCEWSLEFKGHEGFDFEVRLYKGKKEVVSSLVEKIAIEIHRMHTHCPRELFYDFQRCLKSKLMNVEEKDVQIPRKSTVKFNFDFGFGFVAPISTRSNAAKKKSMWWSVDIISPLDRLEVANDAAKVGAIWMRNKAFKEQEI